MMSLSFGAIDIHVAYMAEHPTVTCSRHLGHTYLTMWGELYCHQVLPCTLERESMEEGENLFHLPTLNICYKARMVWCGDRV